MQYNFLTAREAADMLRASERTVYDLFKRGQLEGYKLGVRRGIRIDRGSVERFMRGDKQERAMGKVTEPVQPRPQKKKSSPRCSKYEELVLF